MYLSLRVRGNGTRPNVRPRPINRRRFIFHVRKGFITVGRKVQGSHVVRLQGGQVLVPKARVTLFKAGGVRRMVTSRPSPIISVQTVIGENSRARVFRDQAVVPFLGVSLSTLVQQ